MLKLRPFALASIALLAACGGAPTDDAGTAQVGSGGQGSFPDEPALETDPATLDAGLVCTAFTHPDNPPVLLVHGTFTNGYEQYDWTYLPLLAERGFDVCAITYPDRGLGDMQVSAEYIVYALRKMYATTGRKVAIIGHSQGGTSPRWALKWWKSARDATEDFVAEAGAHHGTLIADPTGTGMGLPEEPEVAWQLAPGSSFNAAMNRDDETPGDVDYTNLYSQFDELVQPNATSMLDAGQDNPHVSNVLLQDICPGRLVDHVSIGTTDALAFALALDAITHQGPLDVARAGGAALCGPVSVIPDENMPTDATLALEILQKENQDSFPDPHLSTEEPPLKPYAQ